MVYNKSDTVNPQKPQIFLNWFKGLCHFPRTRRSRGYHRWFQGQLRHAHLLPGQRLDQFGKPLSTFRLPTRGAQWNNINVNRTGKPISNLTLPTQIAQTPPATLSSAIGNIGYVQTIGGLNVKLTFPNLVEYRPETGLHRPAPSHLNGPARSRQLLADLAFAACRRHLYHRPQQPHRPSPAGRRVRQVRKRVSLVLDYFNPLNTVYTYDVTNFVKVQITNPSPDSVCRPV